MVIIAWFHVARLLVKPGAPGFLKLLLSGKLVCVYVCVCLSVCLCPSQAIKNHSYEMKSE